MLFCGVRLVDKICALAVFVLLIFAHHSLALKYRIMGKC